MRVCVALLITCLVLVGLVAANQQKRQVHSCKQDSECGGKFCFCLKQQYHHYGECICNMDPDFLKPQQHTDDIACFADDDCKYQGHPHDLCSCNKPQNQYFGTCNCVPPLFG